ncbi:MAG: N-acetylglucosamine-6-phosphate deacetylase [Thermomicrobiales bacterium]
MKTTVVAGELLIGAEFVRGAVVIEGGRITGILNAHDFPGQQDILSETRYVAPGFIDLQVNGGFGVEVGEDPDAIRTLAARLPETGVTAFLPTIITSPPASYPKAMAAFEAARDVPGARPLGLHLEGPFLSPQRHGAHRRDIIESADPRLLDTLLESNAVRLVTLAPERPDAPGLMEKLRKRDLLISLGHTNATYEQFEAGIDAGARMATHLYNAMSPFGHREPGAIGAALLDDRITVGLIADGVHSHPASLRLALRAKGMDRIALVTDMMTAAGMPPGIYALGGQQVMVDRVSARLNDGTLAGSLLTMDRAVYNMVYWTDATIIDALRMASEIPARLLRLERMGRICVGNEADLVLLDANLHVHMTIIRGEVVYERGAQ